MIAVWDAEVFIKLHCCRKMQSNCSCLAEQKHYSHISVALLPKHWLRNLFFLFLLPAWAHLMPMRYSDELSILLSVGNTKEQKAGSPPGSPGSFCPCSKGAGCKSTLLTQCSALAVPCLSTGLPGELPLVQFPLWPRNVYFKRLEENLKIKEEGRREDWQAVNKAGVEN